MTDNEARLVPATSLEVTDRMGENAAKMGGGKRVRLKDIEDAIAFVFYVNGEDAVQAGTGEARDALTFHDAYKNLRCTTICVIQMKNGFNLIGQATPVDPLNFDPQVGKVNAYENALRQLWPLMAFALKDKS